MIDLRKIIRALKGTRVRLALTNAFNLDEASAAFGLKSIYGSPNEVLVKITKEEALSLLSGLLFESMAYRAKIMSYFTATSYARQIIDSFSSNNDSYFTNRSNITDTSYSSTPMTASTFDCGLIIRCAKYEYFCIWLEDED